MDLQEKLKTLEQQIAKFENDLMATKATLKTLKKAANSYKLLIEKAKALETK